MQTETGNYNRVGSPELVGGKQWRVPSRDSDSDSEPAGWNRSSAGLFVLLTAVLCSNYDDSYCVDGYNERECSDNDNKFYGDIDVSGGSGNIDVSGGSGNVDVSGGSG